MTAGERLVAIAGATGQAGTLLLAAGTGATAADALVNYSGLGSDTSANHLLAERIGGTWLVRARHRRRR